jgi:hypothetical protein
MKKTLSIQLTETRIDKRDDRESLGELLGEALEVINPSAREWPDARWLARQAIRALCREIIRTGQLEVPVEMSCTNNWVTPVKRFRFQASRN